VRRVNRVAPAMCGPPCTSASWWGGLAQHDGGGARGIRVADPLGRIEEPEDVADVVVFLASDLARFMTGEAVCLTGGAWMD
jgi:meso-butanediol dehydrogenase / (S,S)-butanediol dehydrogenase / diacetyl reductase